MMPIFVKVTHTWKEHGKGDVEEETYLNAGLIIRMTPLGEEKSRTAIRILSGECAETIIVKESPEDIRSLIARQIYEIGLLK